MSYRITSDINSIDKNQWASFVSTHPLGNIFQTPEITQVYLNTKNHEPVVVACYNSGNLVGILVAVIQKEYQGFLGKLSSRSIIWGGPLVEENSLEITKQLLQFYNQSIKTKAIYSQFRNLWDYSYAKHVFLECGFLFEDHLDIHFDLTAGKNILWNNVHPTRKKQINRGYKRGLNIHFLESITDSDLNTCYNLLKLVYRKASLPMPKIDLFMAAFNILEKKGYLKAIIARFEDKIVGFRFFFCYNGLIYDWYAASDHHDLDKYPNDVLSWELINWSVTNGFSRFDFGGAGKPNKPYGVRDYKMKFGGDLINLGRFEKINNKPLFLIGKTGLYFWKLLRRKNADL